MELSQIVALVMLCVWFGLAAVICSACVAQERRMSGLILGLLDLMDSRIDLLNQKVKELQAGMKNTMENDGENS